MSAGEGVSHPCCAERMKALQKELELQVRYEREKVEKYERVVAAELVKQAAEYERRLELLNHSLKLIIDERRDLFSRDAQDIFARENHARHERAYEAVAKLEGRIAARENAAVSRDDVAKLDIRVATLETRLVTWGAALLIGLGIFEFAIRMLWKG